MAVAVSIIIPVFNQVAYTKECLDAIFGGFLGAHKIEVIVVDNGSTDETKEYLDGQAKLHANLRVLRFESNLGFSIPCNRGAEIAKGQELLFLNNDTIPQGDWLTPLRSTLALGNCGLVGPKLVYPTLKTINHAGYVYNGAIGAFYHIYHLYPQDFSGVNRRREFQALLGACVLVPKDLFQQVGGFSLYGLEDIDLCLKIRKAGRSILYEPRSFVYHHGSATLKNSKPGTIPATNLEGFSGRWQEGEILPDDEKYYREDGLSLMSFDGGIAIIRETMTESEALRQQALDQQKSGNDREAVQTYEAAITAFTGNEKAYEDLIVLHLEKCRYAEALVVAQRMAEKVADAHSAKLHWAKLASRVGQRELAERLISELLLDWALPSDLRSKCVL